MRLLHRSQDGDQWLLVKDRSGQVCVEHRTADARHRVELGAFLNDESPPRREFMRLLGTLVDDGLAGPETT
ncbi:hypothetical protein [Chelatococcus reniformis]|uniref:Uncharacterized protein n=1 Tax=Chelatococcus reniformis TaxID=1494448 RepID=A0A916X8X0_9HYPH|nr:hypothetical protein [Chelatococcus reniformis]GGC55483.1 hypothetical protein GCM10010994_12940 [Chelatococcus reniformis]